MVKPQSLQARVVAALYLQPMTVTALASCLSAHQHSVWTILDSLHDEGRVMRSRWHCRAHGRPRYLYHLISTQGSGRLGRGSMNVGGSCWSIKRRTR